VVLVGQQALPVEAVLPVTLSPYRLLPVVEVVEASTRPTQQRPVVLAVPPTSSRARLVAQQARVVTQAVLAAAVTPLVTAWGPVVVEAVDRSRALVALEGMQPVTAAVVVEAVLPPTATTQVLVALVAQASAL
jgi:pectin methylesterase-like acyl-CoA thioesterase